MFDEFSFHHIINMCFSNLGVSVFIRSELFIYNLFQRFLKNHYTFKVNSHIIRLPPYMEELIALPMAQQRQQNIKDAVQNYGKQLFKFIRSRVKNDADAEDIIQDVWYQLSSIIDIEPIEQLSAWLFRVSRNRIVDKQRKKQPHSLEGLALEDEDGETYYPEAILADIINPESELEQKVLREAIFSALEELPNEQRCVFIWNELDDMTFQEIADITGENIKTLISRKRYAVAYLRERLKVLYKD
jgi:RNA polymerase sigma factor (sigma-70 family)